MRIVREFDQIVLPEPRKGAAHGLDSKAQEISDVGSGHRQVDQPLVLAIASVTTRHGDQQARKPLDCTALADGRQEVARRHQLFRHGLVQLEPELRVGPSNLLEGARGYASHAG